MSSEFPPISGLTSGAGTAELDKVQAPTLEAIMYLFQHLLKPGAEKG